MKKPQRMVKKRPIVAATKQALRRLREEAFRLSVDDWCTTNGMPTPIYEHRFHDIRKWRFDVAWPKSKVAVEIHGGLFRFGHHSRGKGFLDDREKIGEAQKLGWKVLEVAPSGKHPNVLYSPEMLDWLKAVL